MHIREGFLATMRRVCQTRVAAWRAMNSGTWEAAVNVNDDDALQFDNFDTRSSEWNEGGSTTQTDHSEWSSTSKGIGHRQDKRGEVDNGWQCEELLVTKSSLIEKLGELSRELSAMRNARKRDLIYIMRTFELSYIINSIQFIS